MLLQFSQNGEAMRLMSGNAYVAADLDPRVIFSSKYRSGVIESFVTTVTVGTAEVAGSFPLAHSYPVSPACFGVAIVGGAILYPYGYSLSTLTDVNSNTSWVNSSEYFVIFASLSGVFFRIKRLSDTATVTIRLWAMG
jgi:hypothetical protein